MEENGFQAVGGEPLPTVRFGFSLTKKGRQKEKPQCLFCPSLDLHYLCRRFMLRESL
jgi:hypothetical protein